MKNRNPNYKKAKYAAELILERLNVERPIFELEKICSRLGLTIEIEKMNYSGDYIVGSNIIKINAYDSRARQFFTFAHELGHYILHNDYCRENGIKSLSRDTRDRNYYDPLEKEANVFAANFLVPKTKLKKMISEYNGDIYFIATYFGVSREVIENRLNSLRMEE